MMTSAERCATKKAYNQSEEALKVLWEAKAKPNTRSPHSLTVYRCNNCRKFHLGHNRALENA
jgi:hypothetical protein